MNSPVSAPDELWLRSRFAEPRTVEPVTTGDGHLWQRDREIRPAAVLVPVVRRESGLTVLFTRRTAHLNDHAGQISFPGGRSEPGDTGAAETALREAAEEIGLAAAQVEVLGKLQEYVTVTGYRVTPVVGLVTPPLELRLDESIPRTTSATASYTKAASAITTPFRIDSITSGERRPGCS